MSNRAKKKLPGYFGREHLEIEFTYLCTAAGVPDNQFEVVTELKLDSDQSIAQMIIDFAIRSQVSVLVLGAFGRKGPSVWGQGSKPRQLLSQCDGMSYVVVPPSNTLESPCTFCVAHDGSKRAKAALAFAASLASPGDRISCIHIRNEFREAKGFCPSEIQEALEETLQKLNGEVHGTLEICERDHTKNTARQILEFAMSERCMASYIVIGRDGVGARELERRGVGTVTNKIICKSRITSVIVGE